VDDPVAVDAAFDKTREALDFVAEHGGADRPLVGDAFSVADLTAASLLAPAVNPPHPDVSRPEPMPEALRVWNARWADHPGTGWVLAQYRLHRPPSSALV
jgi:glutathione S-transferase